MWCSRRCRSRRRGKLFKFWSDHRVSTPHLNKRMSVLKVSRKSVHNWQSYFTKCALVFGTFNCLMIGWVIWAKNVDRNTKKWKRPPKSSKNDMFVFGLVISQNVHLFWITFNFWWLAEWSEQKCWPKQKNEKAPKSSKIKCLFFGLCSTSDDRPSNVLTEMWKNEKRPPKSLKNKMFIFGLHSTFDDWPSDPSKKCWPKCKNKKKRPPKSSKNKMFVFGLHSTSDDRPSDPSKKCWPKCKKTKKAP